MLFPIAATLLDACVLCVLARGDTYGYELTQMLTAWLGVSESTLYPVLRRLTKGGYLTTYDRPYQGRNRRYYRITDTGRAQAGAMVAEWQDYKKRVDGLILGPSAKEGSR
jgi:PadR family transcriptional regulator PadR